MSKAIARAWLFSFLRDKEPGYLVPRDAGLKDKAQAWAKAGGRATVHEFLAVVRSSDNHEDWIRHLDAIEDRERRRGGKHLAEKTDELRAALQEAIQQLPARPVDQQRPAAVCESDVADLLGGGNQPLGEVGLAVLRDALEHFMRAAIAEGEPAGGGGM